MALTRLGGNQAINLATNTTGTLGVANGGTGLASGTTGQFLKFTGSTTLASAADNAGKVLSVTTKTYATQQSSTSSTMASMNLTTASITPNSASSQFLVMLLTHGESGGSNQRLGLQLVHTVSSSDSVFQSSPIASLNSAGNIAGCLTLHGIAAPSTTSAITFGANFDNQTASGTVNVHANNYTSRLTVIEFEP